MPGNSEKYDALLPIPTYEEAISSRPQSSQGTHEPTDAGSEAERQGLLGQNAAGSSRRHGAYQAPTVESARSSYEGGDFTSPEVSSDEDEEELRRDIEQMEVADPEAERRAQQRDRMRQRFHKRIATLAETFSNLHLPRIPAGWNVPSLGSVLTPFRNVAVTDRLTISWPIVARLVALFVIASLVYVLVVVRVLPGSTVMGQRFEADSVRGFLLRHVDPGKIQAYLKEISYDDHIAGTKGDFFLAGWMKKHFEAAKLDEVSTEDFEVYLNYPRLGGRRVAIIDPPELAWQAKLEEDNVSGDNDQRHQAGVFHGHSRSGNVTGPLIYANYGAREDFAYLKDHGIEVNGSVVLVRYYGTQSDRALKVKAAELAGAIGCLIYSDPAEDGFVRGPPGPDGPWRTADSVQRGAVSLMSWVVGDVLTPGWASTSDAPRLETTDNPGLVNIPSLPLSWRDAEPLLKSLQNHGLQASPPWRGGIPNIQYHTGNTSTSPTIHLMNIQDENVHQAIQNVLGRIQGTESLQAESPAIYIGNHRDAWCFGSVDPGSGTAVFMELVRVFGELAQNGWRPRRSIVFASWDAEEYNLIGSTEHVEARIDALRQRGVAYINIDTGVYGDQFRAAGSPMLTRPLLQALEILTDPGTNSTLLQRWNESSSVLEAPSAGSDYVAFQDLAGMSSLDLGFVSSLDASGDHVKLGGPAYPYHSCHETLSWFETHADPGYTYSVLLTQLVALILFTLADTAILPFDLPAYATQIHAHVATLSTDLSESYLSQEQGLAIDLSALHHASDLLTHNALKFMQWEAEYAAISLSSSTSADSTLGESQELSIRRINRNARMAEFETRLLDVPDPQGAPGGGLMGVSPSAEEMFRSVTGVGTDGKEGAKEGKGKRRGGLPGREQFKHVVYGPGLWNGYESAVFPGIRDAMDAKDWDAVREQVQIVAEVVGNAADRLMR